MSGLTCDFIAIDTNIFEHLFNPQMDNEHISEILESFEGEGTMLLIDNGKRINGEYEDRLTSKIERSLNDNGRLLLEYWLLRVRKEEVDVDHQDKLMDAIKGEMGKDKATDRVFAYVAFKRGRILITNDEKDFIDKGNQKGKRRKQLLKKTKRWRPSDDDKSDILTSKEVYERL